MEQTKRKDLFNGSLTKNILLFALPVMATGMLQTLFNTADLAVVGRFDGNDALAAVGSTTAMVHLIVNLLMGLSVGASVVVAQAYGAKDDKTLSKSVHTALSVSIVAGLLVSVVGFAFGGKILALMGTAPEVLDDATLYVKIYFLGAPVSMIYNFGAAILRAVGNTKTPLIFLSASGVINILLNLFLVIVFDMGVAGVAVATVTSQAISAVLVLIYLARRSDACRFYLKKLAFHKKELLRMIAIGLPAGLQSSLFAISNVMIQSSVNSFGSVEIIAGNTAAMSIEGFVYILMNSFSNAGMTFIGQTIGAERYDRVPRVARRTLLWVTIGGLFAGLLCYVLRDPLLAIFLKVEEGSNAALAASYGEMRLFYICAPYFICGVMDVLTGLLRGMGYSTVPMIITVGGVCGLRLVWIYTVFAIFHTPEVLFISYLLSWVVTAIAQGTLYFIMQYRLLKKAGLVKKKA